MSIPTLSKKTEKGEILFAFKNSEDLTQGILLLFFKKPLIKSSLYKSENGYHLIINADEQWPTIKTLSEFSSYKTKNFLLIAITKEHSKLLILDQAVKIYGRAFVKDF